MQTIAAFITIALALTAAGETAGTVKIGRNTGRDATAIAVVDSTTDTVAGIVDEERSRVQRLSHQEGFRSAVVLKSHDSLHVILYTQWESPAAFEKVTKAEDASALRRFSVAYLSARGGDTLALGQAEAPAILINVISTEPQQIDRLYEFWVKGAEGYWLTLPDVIGSALHRSADNRTLINIAAWTTGEAWRKATEHAAGNFAGAHGVGTSDPKLYDVVAVTTR